MAEQTEEVKNYRTAANFGEIGNTGLKRSYGWVEEEYLPQLKMPRCLKVYREMGNDAVVGAVLYMMDMLVRGVTWSVLPGGHTSKDKEIAEFVEQCMNDMSISWKLTIAETLSMFKYGWSWHEIVYKIRRGDDRNPKYKSKYNDGRIGWRKIAGRSQDSWHSWEFNEEDGNVKALVQASSQGGYKTIPLDKSLLFRTTGDRGNPEGRSLLRAAYRAWYFKKRLEEIEGIGIERDLAGYPVLKAPPGVNLWNSKDPTMVRLNTTSQQLVRRIRRDENEGAVIPDGWELSLLSAGGKRQLDIDKTIARYDHRIASTMLADIILIGAEKAGSFALANAKERLLTASLEAQVQNVADIFNAHAIPRLIRVNAFTGYTALPQIVPGDLDVPDLRELGRYIVMLADANPNLFPNLDLEEHLMRVANLPPLSPEMKKERLERLKEKPEEEEKPPESNQEEEEEEDAS